MDSDPDQGGPKTCGFGKSGSGLGSGSATLFFWFSFYSPDYKKMHLNQVKANSNGNIKLMRIGNTAYNLDNSWQNCVCDVIDRKYAGYAERGEATVLANLVPVPLLVVLLVVTPLIEATAIWRRGPLCFQFVSLLIVRRETSNFL
jgi:hypothetical protein